MLIGDDSFFIQSEVRRRDEDIEQRRQEIHRLREQNHGYQERLQKGKSENQPSPAQLSSPALSPSHSRPSSFLSVSSSSDHHDDDPGKFLPNDNLHPMDRSRLLIV